jgi:hypothetical protein
MRIVSDLYKLARAANDISTLASLNPKKIFRRFVVNNFIGKQVARRLYWGGSTGKNQDRNDY